MGLIKAELKERLDWLVKEGKLLEAQRLEQRTTFDLEMIEATGSCAASGAAATSPGWRPGEPPPTFFEYIPDNALLFVDEEPPDRAADRRRCTAATTGAQGSPWPSTASACPAASTTAR